MSVFDLETLDLAYAPLFGSANDPINTAGFVAGHIARRHRHCCTGNVANLRGGFLQVKLNEPR